MFEVYDKRRCEVIGQALHKTTAIEIGRQALMARAPSRRIYDLVVRKCFEPPVKTSLLPGFSKAKRRPTVVRLGQTPPFVLDPCNPSSSHEHCTPEANKTDLPLH